MERDIWCFRRNSWLTAISSFSSSSSTMELPIVDRSHRAGSIHRQITTLTLFSNVTSLTAFAYCIPLGGKKTMIFTPCVSILTLLHHFILLLERRRCCICMILGHYHPVFNRSLYSTQCRHLSDIQYHRHLPWLCSLGSLDSLGWHYLQCLPLSLEYRYNMKLGVENLYSWLSK